ncbi:hypothetical protein Ahy_A07g034325 [Arachis hypogaea]|uniref:ATP-dependent DNA helicase n=1 Tax=Arachis hypogaea TaxID=3818 RepID=A0A445CBI9_ARAHY|nr:hypothetical protein Ahy_A07g034325 [Arachis hypogaea]
MELTTRLKAYTQRNFQQPLNHPASPVMSYNLNKPILKKTGEKVFIPRMTLIPSDARFPFKFQCKEFPLMVSYAIIINKNQGQSSNHVGLLLKQPVFMHG